MISWPKSCPKAAFRTISPQISPCSCSQSNRLSSIKRWSKTKLFRVFREISSTFFLIWLEFYLPALMKNHHVDTLNIFFFNDSIDSWRKIIISRKERHLLSGEKWSALTLNDTISWFIVTVNATAYIWLLINRRNSIDGS